MLFFGMLTIGNSTGELKMLVNHKKINNILTARARISRESRDLAADAIVVTGKKSRFYRTYF